MPITRPNAFQAPAKQEHSNFGKVVPFVSLWLSAVHHQSTTMFAGRNQDRA
jgi:hypothetical protein